MQRQVWVWLTSIACMATACGGADDPGEGADAGKDADAGANAGMSSHGGDLNPCAGGNVTTRLGWDEGSELGPTGSEVFGQSAGSCHAPLVWDATGFDLEQIEPATGKSVVTVEVGIDETSVRLVQPRASSSAAHAACQPWLEVDAHVKLETEDGTFKDAADLTLRYDAENGLSTFGFGRELDEQEGSFSVSSASDVQLSYEFDGAGASCAGEIRLTVERLNEGGSSSASQASIAMWSNSGCPLGQDLLLLDEPLGAGAQTPIERIEEVFGDVVYPGEWDDGAQTELHLQVDVEAETACRERLHDRAIMIPVRVTYGSADGRLREHETDADVRMNGQDVHAFSLWVDDTLRCKDAKDELPYTLNGCDTLDQIQVQLGINTKADGVSFTDSGLTVYEYDRNSMQAGGADRVRMLVLSKR